METLLPVVLSEGHHKRGLPLARVADLISRNPAQLMGIGDRKGAIETGLDADLTFVDLNTTWTLKGHRYCIERGLFDLRRLELQRRSRAHRSPRPMGAA